MSVNLVLLRKLCKKMRCFLEKFTQLAQNLNLGGDVGGVGALPIIQYTGCAKSTDRMLLEPRCTSLITSSRHPLEMFFAGFLLRLSRLKRSQDILVGQFGPTTLNFCYYFYLIVLFWDTQQMIMRMRIIFSPSISSSMGGGMTGKLYEVCV